MMAAGGFRALAFIWWGMKESHPLFSFVRAARYCYNNPPGKVGAGAGVAPAEDGL